MTASGYASAARGFLRMAFRHALYRAHGKIHSTVTVRTKQGRLTVSTRDEGVGAPLFRMGEYEYESSLRTVRFLKDRGMVPQRGASLVDIGANIGFISIGLALSGEIDRAVAIEPEGGNFRLLERNIRQNGLADRILPVQTAVGDDASSLMLELSPSNSGDHRIRRQPVPDAGERWQESRRATTRVTSQSLAEILHLDAVRTFLAPPPSVFWVDVQGYEGYVFRGARDLLRTGGPTVAEIWPYGILRAGMTLQAFADVVADIWTEYWIERRGKFTMYPVTVFDRYMSELGHTGHFENVVLTYGACPLALK